MRDLGGRPLIAWTIEAARTCPLVTRVVVSTEDVEIATYCRREGVEVVPQPLECALSGTRSAPVVLSALNFLRDTEGYEPDVVVLLHPTSPFRDRGLVSRAIHQISTSPLPTSVISVTNDTLNGAIYATTVGRFVAEGTFFVAPITPLFLDEREGLDIDTWDDLERARGMV